VTTPRELLGMISGGRVLDVATGGGGFVHFLEDGLRDFDSIVGIDTSERAAAAFSASFGDEPRIRFVSMDAGHMEFDDASFDVVCMSNSLHHMPNPECTLDEMMRVLHPGGRFIVSEMYRDTQAETQMTHVLLHDWWAAVDSRMGTFHSPTFTRAEIVHYIEALRLVDVVLEDLADLTTDPRDVEETTQLDGVIDRYISQSASLPEAPELRHTGEDLRRRLHTIGVQSATQLFALGRRP
jgi:ubiquinone/menaquinone biosynthesis C-methylase UbiE